VSLKSEISDLFRREVVDHKRENCDDDDLAKQYIDEGLNFFDLDMFWGLDKPQKLQQAFADVATTALQLMSLWMNSYLG
jgi:hypothetical protein